MSKSVLQETLEKKKKLMEYPFSLRTLDCSKLTNLVKLTNLTKAKINVIAYVLLQDAFNFQDYLAMMIDE